MRARQAGVVAALLVALTACSSGSSSKPPVAIVSGGGATNGLLGDQLQPATREPAATLEDTSGKPYALRKDDGKVTLVYFGYTHCPDICPTFMADIAQALRESTVTVRSHVEVLFISVDPRRDSARVIKRWLDHFSSDFIGLRGSIQKVIAVQRAMGVPASRVLPHSKHGYTVEHSGELLAFTPDHLAHLLYLEGPTTISDLQHDLAILTTDPAYGA